jgi:hypothetical protein
MSTTTTGATPLSLPSLRRAVRHLYGVSFPKNPRPTQTFASSRLRRPHLQGGEPDEADASACGAVTAAPGVTRPLASWQGGSRGRFGPAPPGHRIARPPTEGAPRPSNRAGPPKGRRRPGHRTAPGHQNHGAARPPKPPRRQATKTPCRQSRCREPAGASAIRPPKPHRAAKAGAARPSRASAIRPPKPPAGALSRHHLAAHATCHSHPADESHGAQAAQPPQPKPYDMASSARQPVAPAKRKGVTARMVTFG